MIYHVLGFLAAQNRFQSLYDENFDKKSKHCSIIFVATVLGRSIQNKTSLVFFLLSLLAVKKTLLKKKREKQIHVLVTKLLWIKSFWSHSKFKRLWITNLMAQKKSGRFPFYSKFKVIKKKKKVILVIQSSLLNF